MVAKAAIDYQKAMRLDGRGVVVLGAGQGIGLETALALAQQGASVLCVDSDETLAKAAAAATKGEYAIADVTKEEDVARVFEQAGHLFGQRFSGLVDIVGRADLRSISTFTEEAWDAQFALVLKHTFFSLKHAIAKFPASGGTVVFVSSLAGIRSLPGQAVYGAAKAALNHFIASAALELGPRNIRINGVAPGLTKTPRLNAVLGESRLQELAQTIPLRRFGHPHDVAAAILFLTSDLSMSISGAIIPVDGGLTNVSAFPALNLGADLLDKR